MTIARRIESLWIYLEYLQSWTFFHVYDSWSNHHTILLVLAFPKCGLPFFLYIAMKFNLLHLESFKQTKNIPVVVLSSQSKMWRKSVNGFLLYDILKIFSHLYVRYSWPNGWTKLAEIFKGTNGYPRELHGLFYFYFLKFHKQRRAHHLVINIDNKFLPQNFPTTPKGCIVNWSISPLSSSIQVSTLL